MIFEITWKVVCGKISYNATNLWYWWLQLQQAPKISFNSIINIVLLDVTIVVPLGLRAFGDDATHVRIKGRFRQFGVSDGHGRHGLQRHIISGPHGRVIIRVLAEGEGRPHPIVEVEGNVEHLYHLRVVRHGVWIDDAVTDQKAR